MCLLIESSIPKRAILETIPKKANTVAKLPYFEMPKSLIKIGWNIIADIFVRRRPIKTAFTPREIL